MNCGILGGAFNPITQGHLELADTALLLDEVDRVWLLPCYGHRYNKPLEDFDHRIRMTEIAVANWKEPRIEVKDYERKGDMDGSTWKLIEYLKSDLRRLVRDELAFSKEQERQNTVLRIIRDHGRKYAAPIPRATLIRNAHMNAKMLDDVIRTLVESERVYVMPKKGREAARYCLRNGDGQEFA